MTAESTSLQPLSMPLALPLTFSVPLADLGDFGLLRESQRTDVQITLGVLEQLHAAIPRVGKYAALRAIAAEHGHRCRGMSLPSLERKYRFYLAGGWRALVPAWKGPSALPRSFDQYVKKLAEDNQRSMAEAWELLRTELWPRGHRIPGYGTWAEYYAHTFPDRPVPQNCPRGFFPTGWSKRNLYRSAPPKGARVLFQRGLLAAKRYFPSVVRDPSQLRPLELITIDDFELDCLCVFPGDSHNKPQIGRVAGLLAIDVGTRRKLMFQLGQRLERNDQQPDGTVKTVRTGISRVTVDRLLYEVFAKYGLPDYPITILCENASASISPERELSLSTLFDGRIRVERTGLIKHKTLTNGFCERGGKPYEKGWIESMFNYLWNKLGSQRGYKGSNQRLNGPADLADKIKYTRALIAQGDAELNLPPEVIAQLRLPFQSLDELTQAFAWACVAADLRTAHKYLGFDQVTEFRLGEGDEPRPFSELALLAPDQQQNVEVLPRNESPTERWDRLCLASPRQPVPKSVLGLLLLTPKRAAYRNHAVSFVHERAGYSYIDPTGTVLQNLTDGTEFLGYFDPAAPEELQLATLKGAFVGTLQRLGGRRGMVDVRDKEALAAAAAKNAIIFNRTLSEVRGRHADEEQQLAADRTHNDALVAAHVAQATPIAEAAAESAERTQREHVAMAKIDPAKVIARRLARATAAAENAPPV